ncbi:MAG TPA: hypothetical protein GX506_02170 [Firmicutes bacterium]|nr:hypothetical protein [Bacillota bacterium]
MQGCLSFKDYYDMKCHDLGANGDEAIARPGRGRGDMARRRCAVRLRQSKPQDSEYIGTSLESLLGAESMIGAARQIIREALLDVSIGGNELVYMAGPLPAAEYENRSFLVAISEALLGAGCTGIYCGPYAGNHVGPEDGAAAAVKGAGGAAGPGAVGVSLGGMKVLAEVSRATGLAVVVGVQSPGDIAAVEDYADVLEVSAHDLASQDMTHAVIGAGKPVLLARGGTHGIEEWLEAADCIVSGGNCNVVLYEDTAFVGLRDPAGAPDLVAVATAKSLCSLPLIVGLPYARLAEGGSCAWSGAGAPGTGRPANIAPAIAKAAIIAGADGLVMRIHEGKAECPNPDPELVELALKELIQDLSQVARLAGKRV